MFSETIISWQHLFVSEARQNDLLIEICARAKQVTRQRSEIGTGAEYALPSPASRDQCPTMKLSYRVMAKLEHHCSNYRQMIPHVNSGIVNIIPFGAFYTQSTTHCYYWRKTDKSIISKIKLVAKNIKIMTANPSKMSFNKGMDKNKILFSDGYAMLSITSE